MEDFIEVEVQTMNDDIKNEIYDHLIDFLLLLNVKPDQLTN